MNHYRKLAGMVKDDYSAVRAHAVVGDWLAARGRGRQAVDAYVGCIRTHPRTRHVLPIYRKALRVARGIKASKTEITLQEGLAANFPHRALGRFAAGELKKEGILLVAERRNTTLDDAIQARRALGAQYGKVVGAAVQTARRARQAPAPSPVPGVEVTPVASSGTGMMSGSRDG